MNFISYKYTFVLYIATSIMNYFPLGLPETTEEDYNPPIRVWGESLLRLKLRLLSTGCTGSLPQMCIERQSTIA